MIITTTQCHNPPPQPESNDAFGEILRSLVSPELLEVLGAAAENLGTHSVRKGACTETAGQPQGPDPDSISLRMDHQLDASKGLYKLASTGTDRFVGRPGQ